ncbi:MAG: ABC transporter substrate-binding protein [Treponema sp.]|nr:ABC transporter substrate-binding protein [Treponema sp.]MCL2252284.1 ABC transporter substrate-binding protein [Treponema sp.]
MKCVFVFSAALVTAILCLFCFSCIKYEELTLEEFEALNAKGLAEILAKTVSKPWLGQDFLPGKVGGSWRTVMNEDPKSFNHLIAEQDSSTSFVVSNMTDYLIDYDSVKRQWVSNAASYQIVVDEVTNTMQVIYTLRDDLYWSYYNSEKKIKVTSDDVIFWYNEIEGDSECQSSGYYGQFLLMSDGSEERITIRKIDDRSFAFHFPRIIAEPLLSTNMDFGPKHIYESAKESGGVDGIRSIFSVAIDPKTMPSMGEWFLTEYNPGQRLVYKRNPDYWKKDSNNLSLPFIEEMIVRIIPEENTKLLLFKNGESESYSLRPEDLDGVVNRGDGSYTVFNSEGSLSASFWTFNQNPVNSDKPKYDWFIKKEFRQAMSCLLNRNRINTQVYRGLAEPKLNIYPEPNPFYNPELTLQYLFDTERAMELLSGIGIKQDRRGVMRDWEDRRIEFDLTIRADSSISLDTASIIRDELSKIGIKLNIRVLDFQKQVQQLFTTFDWDSMLIGLSGSGIFPSQGSNVWPSSGNLHMWHPNQTKPATEWEARLDYLYNEGQYTIDKEKAQIIWDEFQSILLEQCPLIYLMRSRGFWAINNRWDLTNVYFDNMRSAQTNHIYIN